MSSSFSEVAAIRLGFGFSPRVESPSDPETLLASISDSGPGPHAVSTATAIGYGLQLGESERQFREGGEAKHPGYKALRNDLNRLGLLDLRRRVVRAVDAQAGFGERLVQFWSNHFTTRAVALNRQALALAFQDEAIRPHIGGRFEDLFFAADTHPMMLVYLDQVVSRGPNSRFVKSRPERRFGLNENLAREALELHSLGVDADYTQGDVRAFAKILTGLTVNQEHGFAYQSSWAEPGPLTVLGMRYGDSGTDGPAPERKLEDIRVVFGDIAARQETARHLSRKLAVHFAADTPPEDLVEDMAEVWQQTDGDLPAVYAVLVNHPDLAATFGQKIRQPFDLNVAAIRALGLTGSEIEALDLDVFARAVAAPMAAMGQPWGQPKGPDGWPEAPDAWIAPQTLAARIDWALEMPRQLLGELPDPRELMLAAFAGVPPGPIAWVVPKAETAAEGIAIVLASNAFNRR